MSSSGPSTPRAGGPRRRPRAAARRRLRRRGSPSWPGTALPAPPGRRRRRPDDYLTAARWYQEQQAQGAELPAAIAYFSPEFGITAALPQYSGGLGILAGDHLKAASDLGVPLIGVGLLYRHGYFRQSLSRDGWQQEHYPVLDPQRAAARPAREADGTPAQVVLALPGGRSPARPHLAGPGRPGPAAAARLRRRGERPRRARGHRPALRRRQRAPAAPGDAARHRRGARRAHVLPAHRARRRPRCSTPTRATPASSAWSASAELARRRGSDFDAALEAVRAGTVFTTHTPVPAGIDRFDRELVARHFGDDGELPRHRRRADPAARHGDLPRRRARTCSTWR